MFYIDNKMSGVKSEIVVSKSASPRRGIKKHKTYKEKLKIFSIIAQKIIEENSLDDIFESKEVGISKKTFFNWMNKDETGELFKIYNVSKQVQAEILASRLIQKSQEYRKYIHTDEYGRKSVDNGIVRALNLEISVLQWYLSKLAPKIYGNQLKVESENVNVNQIKIEVVEPTHNPESILTLNNTPDVGTEK